MEKGSQDEAAKARIIKHMNTDHQDSLIRYLEHFCHLSSFSAANAKLESLTLGSLSISSRLGRIHLIPIQPPMASWSEARTRFAALDGEAVKGLGRSDITVKEILNLRQFAAARRAIRKVLLCNPAFDGMYHGWGALSRSYQLRAD
ncbi:hypothetical protein Q9189_008215 [Teloschistes chrysophthalmus]